MHCCYCCLGGGLCSVQQHKKMYSEVRQPGYIRMKKYLIPTAGSDKHNRPQQYCGFGCVEHAWCVGGRVGTMGSVHGVCCIPGLCLSCVLTAHEGLGEKTDNMFPIRTYQVRPLVSKPGKWSYPLPSGKKL